MAGAPGLAEAPEPAFALLGPPQAASAITATTASAATSTAGRVSVLVFMLVPPRNLLRISLYVQGAFPRRQALSR